MNYFDIFGIKKGFSIDRQNLESKYLELQKKHHPDNFIDFAEKIKNADFSSHTNIAYTTLIDETKRVEYLLKLENIDLEKSKNILDADRLEEILCDMELVDDLNSKIEDKVFLDILNRREELQNKLIKNISSYFDFKIGDIESAIRFFAEYKYNIKIIERIRTKFKK
jgi:molecular chaperone HscB